MSELDTAAFQVDGSCRRRASRWVFSWALSAVVVAAAMGNVSCKSAADKISLPAAASATPGPAAVQTIKPSLKLEQGTARVTGTVRSRNEASLSAKASAQIVRMPIEVGDKVKAGQVLVQLDSSQPSIALRNAQAAERLALANHAMAEDDLARSKALHENGAVTDAMMQRATTGRDVAAAQLEQARAAVAAARKQLADCTITAPFAGTITGKFKNVGDTVTAMAAPVVSLADLDQLEARLLVPEAMVAQVHEGDVLKAQESPSGEPLEVRVRVIGSVVDPLTRSVEVLADVSPRAGNPVRSGAIVTADLGGAEGPVGPFLPKTVVQQDDKGSFVLVVVQGKLERRNVEVSPVGLESVRVLSGVTPEDVVVSANDGSLRPGDAVRVLAN